MNNMRRFLFFSALLLMFAAVSKAQTGGADATGDDDAKYATALLAKGTAAPDFTIGGKAGSLSSLNGKYVVIDFWATWCPDCRKDIPKMKQLYEKYASDRIVFVGVSFDKTPEALDKYLKDNGVKWVQTCEYKPWKETQISKDYHIKWIPSMYIINPDSKVELATVMIEKVESMLAKIKDGE